MGIGSHIHVKVVAKEILKIIKKDSKFTTLPSINEQINRLEETMMDTEVEIEYSKDNIEYCSKNEIKLASKLSKSVIYGNRKNKDKFEYNKDAGMYVCKAGHMAIKRAKQGSLKKMSK